MNFKFVNKCCIALLALMLGLQSPQVLAKRLGGGSSMGKQSNLSQRQSAPASAPGNSSAASAPAGASGAAAPANAAKPAPAATPATPSAPAPAPAPSRPWMGMLGGLAAGIGIAALASHFGFGEAMGQMVSTLLIVLAVGVVVMLLLRLFRRPQHNDAMAYQGAGAQRMPSEYRPENVGNDASARPYEREGAMAFEAPQPVARTSLVGLPADFDAAAFLAQCKKNFVHLQQAWDVNDRSALKAMMTDEMLVNVESQLSERGNTPNKTDVVTLQADLLGIEDLGVGYLASVEFSGMIREEISAGATPFREIWNLTKPKDGSSGWLLAGVQAMQ